MFTFVFEKGEKKEKIKRIKHGCMTKSLLSSWLFDYSCWFKLCVTVLWWHHHFHEQSQTFVFSFLSFLQFICLYFSREICFEDLPGHLYGSRLIDHQTIPTSLVLRGWMNIEPTSFAYSLLITKTLYFGWTNMTKSFQWLFLPSSISTKHLFTMKDTIFLERFRYY